MDLESKIEAILFFKGESVSILKLKEILKVELEDLKNAINSLKENLKDRGIVLQEKDQEILLSVSSKYGDIIENLQKEELNKELSKASLETISIILYKNGANRAEIDYIRGVNSSFTLRALSIRGLIERVVDPKDNRKYLYKPTFELLSFMGLKSIEELPEYNGIISNLNEVNKNFLENSEES